MSNCIETEREQYYFPEQLKKQLIQIPNYPVTVVEAPSGFGKTTAVRECLKAEFGKENQVHWYTCLGEPTEHMWNGICRLIGYADSNIADRLMELGLPSQKTISEAAALLRALCCETERYLVIDNYQILDRVVPQELLSAMAFHCGRRLHIIVITQQLSLKQQTALRHSMAYIIPAVDFFFDKSSTARLFKQAGIRLNEEELGSIHAATEGWVSALRLQIMNYERNKCFQYHVDMEHLVEAAIWENITEQEKEFLLAISVLDSFTLSQARKMTGGQKLPEEIAALLSTNALIRFYPEDNTYVLHSILHEYLRKRFYHYQSDIEQRRLLTQAGHSCEVVSDYIGAAHFYSEAENYDAFLSFALKRDYLSCFCDRILIGLIVKTLRKCPTDILHRYPESALIFAFHLFLFEQYEMSDYLCRVVGTALDTSSLLDQKERRRLRGEREYLLTFMEYNNLDKMVVRMKSAYELLGGPSSYRFALGNFGSVSIVYMYWRKSGELKRVLELMEENLPLFCLLSGGHSMGSNSAMRAEWLLLQGETEEARILCHQAIYQAKREGQICICLCAELVLARIAVLLGDDGAYLMAVEHIRQYKESKPGRYTERAAELCQGFLALTLGEAHELADWLRDPQDMEGKLYPATYPYGQQLYGRYLLKTNRYSELYGISQPFLELSKKNNYILPQVYHLLNLASAKYSSGCQTQAQGLLNQALELALPDQVYLPFAEYDSLLPLLQMAVSCDPDRDGIGQILLLHNRQQSGVKSLTKALAVGNSPLTLREREIALLARERLSTKEIAERLYIAEGTVKSALKSIYRKLDINSKAQLNKINV